MLWSNASPFLRLSHSIVLLFLGVGFASAGVIGASHDLTNYVTDLYTPCAFCHIRKHLFVDDGRSWPPAETSGQRANHRLNACAYCHLPGVGLIAAAQTPYPFPNLNPRSHGLDPRRNPDGVEAMDRSLPYLAGSWNLDSFSCGTCHDPHNNTHRPFLRRPFNELCRSCHPRPAKMNGLKNSPGESGSAVSGSKKSQPCRADCSECHRAHPHD